VRRPASTLRAAPDRFFCPRAIDHGNGRARSVPIPRAGGAIFPDFRHRACASDE
jgi:hypothetical protein